MESVGKILFCCGFELVVELLVVIKVDEYNAILFAKRLCSVKVFAHILRLTGCMTVQAVVSDEEECCIGLCFLYHIEEILKTAEIGVYLPLECSLIVT